MDKNEVKTTEDKKIYFCCVKNCHKKLSKDDMIRFGDSVFCRSCGTAIVKQSLLG